MSKTKAERIDDALDIARDYGGTDGAHHKMWGTDQMVRALAGDDYEGLIRDWEEGEDGMSTKNLRELVEMADEAWPGHPINAVARKELEEIEKAAVYFTASDAMNEVAIDTVSVFERSARK